MYHIVYLTTNLVNSKIYVGVHSTYNLNDGYLGTGQNIKRAIRKYGKHNFKRDILYQCIESCHAYEIEKNIVTKDFLNRNDVYNINLGGILVQTDIVKYKISKSLIKYVKTEEHKKNISESWKSRNLNKNIDKRRNSALKGEETKRKNIETLGTIIRSFLDIMFWYYKFDSNRKHCIYNPILDRESQIHVRQKLPDGYLIGSRLLYHSKNFDSFVVDKNTPFKFLVS